MKTKLSKTETDEPFEIKRSVRLVVRTSVFRTDNTVSITVPSTI
jgi:hypothetical protein